VLLVKRRFASTAGSARPQLFFSLEPIFFRGSIRATASAPEFMRQRGDLILSERSDAVLYRRRLGLLMCGPGALERLP